MDDETPPLMLVHGLIGSLDDPSILAAFGDRVVLAPPLLGYGGRADEDLTGLRLEDQADLRAALDDGLALHLVAGERSRDGWHVPADIEHAARSSTTVPGCGHLMMLESPDGFAAAVTETIDEGA